MERFSLKMGMVDVDVCISSHLKEELACIWAADKVISTIMLLKNSYSAKELKETK